MSETVIEEAPPAAPQMPQIPLTDQERLIDEAMTSCGGKFNRVARRLKMNPKTLRGIILTSPHLSKTWADIEEPVSKEDVDMALKTEVEDEAVVVVDDQDAHPAILPDAGARSPRSIGGRLASGQGRRRYRR